MEPRKRITASSGWMLGGGSLLMIFAVLCLTIFALLSLNTAAAGARLSARSAEAVTAYYQAETKAHQILTAIRQGELPEEVTKEGTTYRYICPISDTAELAVTVQVEKSAYKILQWQSRPAQVWEADTKIEVWGGENTPS